LIFEEAKFLAGEFFDLPLPREKAFIFRYFRSPLERQFVRYYICFGQIDNFIHHTGFFCQRRWLRILRNRYEKLVKLHEKYKTEGNLEKLNQLEKGKLKHLKTK
jgi:hypothetical protein